MRARYSNNTRHERHRRRERGRADAAFVFQLAGSFKHLFFFILSNQWFRLPTRLVTPGYRDRSRVCPICSVFLSIWKKKSLKYKCSGKRISTWRIHSGYILINIIMNIVDLSLERKDQCFIQRTIQVKKLVESLKSKVTARMAFRICKKKETLGERKGEKEL